MPSPAFSLPRIVLEGIFVVGVLILDLIDLLMRAIIPLLSFAGYLTTTASSLLLTPQPVLSTRAPKRPRVVIIGGSFGGLACVRHLSSSCDITLIDRKTYFEATPSVLRLFTYPGLFRTLIAPLDTLEGVAFVHGSATYVGEGTVRFVRDGGRAGEEEVECDAVIVASGSTYPGGIKHAAGGMGCDPDSREREWEAMAERLEAAGSVCVLGGGAVGVELAAEIAVEHPSKRVSIIDSHPALCDSFAHPSSCAHISRFFASLPNAECLLGSRITHTEDTGGGGGSFVLEGGREVRADLWFDCRGGGGGDTAWLGGSPAGAAAVRGRGGGLRVGLTMQVEGMRSVFALGDVARVEGGARPRLGHWAEVQARTVCENVARMCEGRPLASFPPGDDAEASLYAISLGKADATVRFGPLVVHGPPAAFLKYGIEWTKVAQQRQRPVGVAVWALTDLITGSTIDRGSMPVLPEGGGGGRIKGE